MVERLRALVGVWREDPNWFGNNIARKLRNSLEIDFWRHTWKGSIPLNLLFPGLFDIV